jgi:SH3-like domain-containing protein
VMGPTGVLVSPYNGAGATGDLHPGAVVVVGSHYGNFVRVSCPDGAGGWVASGVLQSVVGASM